MGGEHYLHLRLGGFLSSQSAGKMHFGDRGDSVSRGAPRLGGAKWHKSRIRASLLNRHKLLQMLNLQSGSGPNELMDRGPRLDCGLWGGLEKLHVAKNSKKQLAKNPKILTIGHNILHPPEPPTAKSNIYSLLHCGTYPTAFMHHQVCTYQIHVLINHLIARSPHPEHTLSTVLITLSSKNHRSIGTIYLLIHYWLL